MATQPLSFERIETVGTSGLTKGRIYFETSTGCIKVATSTTASENYSGEVKDATFTNSVLVITKRNGAELKLDFSDVASASDVTSLLATLRTDINTNKTNIATLTNKVDTLATSETVSEIATKVSALETTINGNSTTTGLVTKVSTNTTNISDNTSAIATLDSKKANQTGDSNVQFSVKTPTDATHAANKSYVDTKVSTAISSAYKVKGCLADKAALVAITSPSNGDVYNVSAQVTVAASDVGSGSGKFGAAGVYPAGTNFVWVEHTSSDSKTSSETSSTKHWDALGGTVDLSGYATTEAVTGQISTVTSSINSVSNRVSTIEGSYVKDFTSTHNGANTGDYTNQISVTSNSKVNGSVSITIDEKELDLTLANLKSSIATVEGKAGVTSFGTKTGAITVDTDASTA